MVMIMSEETKGEERKTIVIRGIDTDIYRKISEISKRTNRTIGEITTQAYKVYLALVEFGERIATGALETIRGISETLRRIALSPVVRDLEELSLSRKDLEIVKEPIMIIGVKRLVIEDDVTPELFEKTIREIIDVEKIEVPETLPKIMVLSKCRFVKKLEVRGKKPT